MLQMILWSYIILILLLQGLKEGLKNLGAVDGVDGKSVKPRLIPAFELLNVVEKLEQLEQLELLNATLNSEAKSENQENVQLANDSKSGKRTMDTFTESMCVNY